MRHVGMMRGFLVRTSFMVLCSFLVVTSGVLKVFCRLLVMLRGLLGHGHSLPPDICHMVAAHLQGRGSSVAAASQRHEQTGRAHNFPWRSFRNQTCSSPSLCSTPVIRLTSLRPRGFRPCEGCPRKTVATRSARRGQPSPASSRRGMRHESSRMTTRGSGSRFM